MNAAVAAFIVGAHSEGITLGQPEQKMGIRASDTRTATFDRVRVPVWNVLGDVGQGFMRMKAVAERVLDSMDAAPASPCDRG